MSDLFNVKELYFCCSKYKIILEVMDNPASEANAMKNFQAELDELVAKGCHTKGCEGYEDVELHVSRLRELIQQNFPRIEIKF